MGAAGHLHRLKLGGDALIEGFECKVLIPGWLPTAFGMGKLNGFQDQEVHG